MRPPARTPAAMCLGRSKGSISRRTRWATGRFSNFHPTLSGAAARKKMKGRPHRRKVTFAWHADDIAKPYTGLFQPGADVYKFFDLPIANYGSSSFDKVVDEKGNVKGLSMFGGYSTNERQALSLGVVDP